MINLMSQFVKFLIVTGALVANAQVFAETTTSDNKVIIGWLEKVTLDKRMQFEAKIDTGAEVSSVNANVLSIYETNGQDRVTFELENKAGKHLKLDKELIRIVQIKRKRAEPVERPVVLFDVCLGNRLKRVEVNLAQRGNYDYKMLIGRSFLRNDFVVDSSASFTIDPACK